MSPLATILRAVEDALHIAGCLALGAVAVRINADIFLRLFADRPVQIQFELTEFYLMPALATLSLSRVFRDGGHLALEIVPADLFGPASGLVHRVVLILSAIFFGVVAYVSGHFTLEAFMRGDIEYGVIDWPLGWAYAPVPLGCGVLALRLVYDSLTPSGAPSVASQPFD